MSLSLYNFTLQRATQITHAVHGNFSGTKQQLIAVGRGKILELLRPDATTGKLSTLLSLEVFGVIRSMLPFRLTGGQKDYLVVGSDSGRIVVLEYNPDKNIFERVHMETYGKSGCRRIVPGQYLAVDPKGRAIMIAALEKQKLTYIMNRDSAARLTISSPLEAHKGHTIVAAIAALDVGFENPVFACLETNYEECDQDPTGDALRQLQQTLTFYELDLGLNHMVRKESVPLDAPGHMLITVPGGDDGPGGVLVCGEDFVTWRKFGPHTPVTVRIPHRKTIVTNDRTTLFVSFAMHKTKTMSFFLLQTEEGDLFKLTIVAGEGQSNVSELQLKYFDTVPVASALCLLRNGSLFVAAEFGSHQLLRISKLGDNEDEPIFSSHSKEIATFTPRGLMNLTSLDELNSLAPILDCKIADLSNEESPQFYCAIGRGPRSSLRTLRHGLEVTQLALSDLPGTPNAVWTVRRQASDPHDSYIVVSFVNATLVLSIGDSVEEVTDSGFLATFPTIACGRVGDDSLIQVYPEGIRHIRSDRRINEWKVPSKRIITHATMNNNQVAISLSGGEIVYFEMDSMGTLNEYQERMELPSEVTCLGVAAVPPGAQRTRFLAVGLQDGTVRLVSLNPGDTLQLLSTQALPGRPESLVLSEMGEASDKQLYLFIGVDTGVMLRSVVDNVTGDLSDTRTRYLGVRGVRLYSLRVQGQAAVLALSSRPWLSYLHQGQMRVTPLSYDTLDYASMFSSEQCVEGIVAIAKHTLRIFTVDRLGLVFNQTTTPLQYTPRKIVQDTRTNLLYLIEGDHNAVTPGVLAQAHAQAEGMDVDAEDAPAKIYGEPRAGYNRWVSNIRIFDPTTNQLVFTMPLDPNEIATSIAIVLFQRGPGDVVPCVVVGSLRDYDLHTNSYAASFINTYQFVGANERQPELELMHKTPVEFPVSALLGLHGKLIAGVGRLLRLYELGMRKLLRKCENKHLPSHVVSLSAMGTRVAVCDMRDSIVFVKFKPSINQLCIFADDTSPRWCTTACWMDYNTVAVADKFGNVCMLRLPADINDEVDDDPQVVRALWNRGLLNGASQKAECIASFYLGDTVLSLQKTAITPGGTEMLVYSTLAGSLGCIVPFTNKEDVDFFQHLEMFMRTESPPLLGRDHLSYRSSYMPSKSVVDGDLCEMFNSLDPRRKRALAEELRRSPGDVSKKLEDIRNRFAF